MTELFSTIWENITHFQHPLAILAWIIMLFLWGMVMGAIAEMGDAD